MIGVSLESFADSLGVIRRWDWSTSPDTKRRNLAEKRLRSTEKLLSLARWTVSEGVAPVSCENMQAGSDVKRRSIQMFDRRSIQQLNQMLKTRAVESDVEDKCS
ncbi:heat shock protein 90-1 [Dorcoceras hygrometricum]|uniref:Heat shock protein 90-1 n=1 Tax=Dorcoceras hygrometricum TaxID=472368 RepID=A0A2Z7CM76_9LAMI|nr:heat shock protein 90-1 [Dorcoceras hygrometricum]